MQRTKTLLLLSILAVIALSTCKNNPPEPPPPPPEPVPTISLSVEDLGVTEAWVRVAVAHTVPARTFMLTRDDQTVDSLFLVGLDTVLLDEGLEPNHEYTYAAYRLDDGLVVDSTDSVLVTTLDTTSHEFTWEMVEFGDHSSSVLLDVAIINENDIWAVGEIFLNDSTGQVDPIGYNAAHWDGEDWDIIRIQFPTFCGHISTAPFRATGSFLFLSGDLWISSIAGSIAWWDGTMFTILCIPPELLPGNITKIWGETTNSVYVVGERGTIVHWDGSSWQRIESGTDVNINDVWGARDPLTGEIRVLAAASNRYTDGEKLLLEIFSNGLVDNLSWGPQRRLNGIWFRDSEKIFVCGSTVYTGQPGSWDEVSILSMYFSTRVRGSERNNIFVTGAFGLFGHFNGVAWQSYPELYLPDGTYEGLDVHDSLVVAVGQIGSRAAILRGVR